MIDKFFRDIHERCVPTKPYSNQSADIQLEFAKKWSACQAAIATRLNTTKSWEEWKALGEQRADTDKRHDSEQMNSSTTDSTAMQDDDQDAASEIPTVAYSEQGEMDE